MKKIKRFYLIEGEKINKFYFNEYYYLERLLHIYHGESFKNEMIDNIWYDYCIKIRNKKINCWNIFPREYCINI